MNSAESEPKKVTLTVIKTISNSLVLNGQKIKMLGFGIRLKKKVITEKN